MLRVVETTAIIAMRKPWRAIAGFALFGPAIAGACYAYAAFFDPNKPMTGFDFALTLASVIFFASRNSYS